MMPAIITMATMVAITLPVPHSLRQGSFGFLTTGSSYVMANLLTYGLGVAEVGTASALFSILGDEARRAAHERVFAVAVWRPGPPGHGTASRDLRAYTLLRVICR